jgi:uncharacterized protein (TIGR02231 family)
MNNKIITTVTALLIFTATYSKENAKLVKSDINEVTVFLSGAQVTSVASISIPAGTTNIVFEGLSPYILNDNIQARGDADFTILSVVRKLNYLTENDMPKEIKVLTDSMESLQTKLDFQKQLREIYEQEEKMLLANKSIGGQNTGVNVAELEKAANLLRSRLTEIQLKTFESKQKEKKLQDQIYKINLQINEMNAKKLTSVSEVTVSVSAKMPVSGKLFISYLVSNAGWMPYYDIRAIDNNSPIKLEYKAKVWQNTGYDWDAVKLTLSTANPNQSNTQPNMLAWNIYLYDNYQYKDKSDSSSYGYTNSMPPSSSYEVEVDAKKEETKNVSSNTSSSFTTMVDNQVNTSFEINIPYTIPTDNKKYAVDIQTFSVPATYKYYCAPKIDKDAFLLAKITGWDKYNLMNGEANIFYEGVYVGKSFLNTRNTTDTLDISLGRDKNVVVTRIKLQEFCEKKVIGLTKKETITFEISVRNKKKQEIEILIEDQIPVSTNKDVEVELMESTGAKYDAVQGKLSWNYKLTTGENKKIKMSFSVKYPKDKVLSGF